MRGVLRQLPSSAKLLLDYSQLFSEVNIWKMMSILSPVGCCGVVRALLFHLNHAGDMHFAKRLPSARFHKSSVRDWPE